MPNFVVILFNFSSENFIVNNGDRIAQMVCTPTIQIKFKEVDELSDSSRGEGGFGSTGVWRKLVRLI